MFDRSRWVLAAALLGTLMLPAPASLAAPAAAESVGLGGWSDALRAAISSGEWERVRPFFVRQDDPVLAFLAGGWREMLAGRLDPVAWEVAFEPYATRTDRATGRLTIAARLADGRRLGQRFNLALIKRGSRWLIGEGLRFQQQDARITRHDLVVDLRGEGLACEDTLTLVPDGPERDVYVELAPSLTVASVSAGRQPLPFAQVGEMLYFERPAGAGPSEVTVRYAGRLPEGDYDYVRPGAAMLRSDFPWYPRVPETNPFAVFRARLLVPAGLKAIAVGDLDGVDRFADHWAYQWTTTRAVEGLTVYAGRYNTLEATKGPVRLEAHVAPEQAEGAAACLDEAGGILSFYGARLGAYPYRKLALVQTAFPGGYGASSAVSLPAEAFARPALRDEFLAHEIAHNWTDLVSYRGTIGERGFMAEGMASYLDLLYRAERQGPAGFRRALQAAHERIHAIVGTPEDVPLARANQEGERLAWQVLTYDKGALVLHMLRQQLGDAAFWGAARQLYSTHQGQPIDLATFRAAFEAAGKTNLAYFFEQWLNRPGLPAIEPDGLRVVPDRQGTYRVLGALRQQGQAYAMSVPLVVVSDSGKTLYQVKVRARETAFQLLVKGKPRFLLVDPLGDALLSPIEPIPLGS